MIYQKSIKKSTHFLTINNLIPSGEPKNIKTPHIYPAKKQPEFGQKKPLKIEGIAACFDHGRRLPPTASYINLI